MDLPALPSLIQTPKCCHSFTRELQRARRLNLRGRSQPSRGLFLNISLCTKRSNPVSLPALSQHAARGGCEGGAACFSPGRVVMGFVRLLPGVTPGTCSSSIWGGPARSTEEQLHTHTGLTGGGHRAPKGSWGRKGINRPPGTARSRGHLLQTPGSSDPLSLCSQERPADTERRRGRGRLRPA